MTNTTKVKYKNTCFNHNYLKPNRQHLKNKKQNEKNKPNDVEPGTWLSGMVGGIRDPTNNGKCLD